MLGKNFLSGVILTNLLLVAPVLHAATWEYETTDDPMTDESIYESVISSDNQVDVSFNKKAQLSVITRFHPRTGWAMELKIDNGQISCLNNCYATIRFDAKKATSHVIEEVFNVKGSVYRLRNNVEKLAADLFNAQQILIELPIFDQGTQLFRFETNAFDYELFPHKPHEKEKRIEAEKQRLTKLYLERIRNNWVQPKDMAPNAYAMISFETSRTGEIDSVIVLAAKIGSVTQHMEFKRSVEEAIRKSSPLPLSEHDDLRQAIYRFNFRFPS